MGKCNPETQLAFRSEAILAEFAPIPGLLRTVRPEFRAPLIQEMMDHPAYLLMQLQLADLNVVYSLPKVGSTTISETLARHPSIRSHLPHIHYLSPEGIAFAKAQLEPHKNHPNAHLWHQHLAHCHWLRVLLTLNRTLRQSELAPLVRKPFVIAGVREPVAQYLSLIFQRGWMYGPNNASLTTDFIRARMQDDPWIDHRARWFRDELGATFELDVFARDFPRERGWDVYENDVARVLIVRQENLSDLPEALGALYGFDPNTVEMANANEGDNKEYAAEYANVKKTFWLSEEELEQVYSLPHVRHFYSPGEIELFKRRWDTPGGDRTLQQQPKLHKAKPTPSSEPPRQRSSPKPSLTARVLARCRKLAKGLFPSRQMTP